MSEVVETRRPESPPLPSARPPASPRTTTSPRPGARSCASTSRGCSPARPGRAPATTPRSSTRCASRPDGSGRPGASSAASFRTGRTKRYRNGLREIAARLGAVRDLDVLLEAADHYRADLPVVEQRALEPLLADWRDHRDDARVLLIRELDSDGYRRWVDDYRDFVRTEGAAVHAGRAGPAAPRPRHRRRRAIWTAYEQVRGYEPVLRWADVETLHDLRIAGQVAALHARVRARGARRRTSAPLIARVTALQDHLGLMNDADVSASMARTFLVEHAGDLSALESAAIGRYLVSREREVARLRRTIGRAVARRRRDRLPARARAGGRRALAAPRGGQPASRGRARGSRSRQARPGVVGGEDRALADPGLRHAERRRRRSAAGSRPRSTAPAGRIRARASA